MDVEWPGSTLPAERWEYKMECIDFATVDVEARCNELGSVGWELVSTTPYQTAGTIGLPMSGLKTASILLFFKRRVAERRGD